MRLDAFWCNASTPIIAKARPCRATQFLYVGSDIDVSLLRFMQPWETSAIYWDDFRAPGTMHYRGHPPNTSDGLDLTTENLRPLQRRDAQQVQRLERLILRQLNEVEEITAARKAARMRFSFFLHGIMRSLHFRLSPITYPTVQALGYYMKTHLNVSTIAYVGYQPGSAMLATMHEVFASKCLPATRLIGSGPHAERDNTLRKAGLASRAFCVRHNSVSSKGVLLASETEDKPPSTSGVLIHRRLQKHVAWRLAGDVGIWSVCLAPPRAASDQSKASHLPRCHVASGEPSSAGEHIVNIEHAEVSGVR